MRKVIFFMCVVLTINVSAGFDLSDLGSGKKYFKQAEKFFKAGQYQLAIGKYLKFLSKKKNANNEVALYHLSICYMETGHPDKGFPYVERLYRFKGTELKYAVLYAEYLVQLNRLKDAINVYKGILSLYPDDYLSYIRVGQLMVNDGRLKEARDMWIKALALKDKPSEAYALLSESYLNVEKNKLMAYYYAKKLYEIADPEKKHEIKAMLDSIAGEFKHDFENFYLLKTCKEEAKIKIESNDFEEAFFILSRCENLENIDKEYLLMFADVSIKLKKWNKAIELFKKCLALGFENGKIYFELGKCYLQIGEKSLAKVNLKMALKYNDTKNDALKILNSI